MDGKRISAADRTGKSLRAPAARRYARPPSRPTLAQGGRNGPAPASIGKNPIHPILVPLPIGLWVFSLVSDVVYAFVCPFLSLTDPRVKRIDAKAS